MNALAYSDTSALRDPDAAAPGSDIEVQHSHFTLLCSSNPCGMLNRSRQAAEGESAECELFTRHITVSRHLQET